MAKQPLTQEEITNLHQTLIDTLIAKDQIQSPTVEAAFRAIPRHIFLPDVDLARVYSDAAIPTKKINNGQAISSSSQPAIMAIMLEQLALQPGQRVLEIGAGTGYNAALMAHLVGEHGQVTTLDLDQDIVDGAQAHLTEAGFGRVKVLCQDGVAGFAEEGPFDRIVLTVGSWDIAPAWRDQLADGGKLVLPLALGHYGEWAVAFNKSNGRLISQSIQPCGFMKLRGSLAAKPEIISAQIGPEPGLTLTAMADQVIDAEQIYTWLSGPWQDWDTRIDVSWRETRVFGQASWFENFNTCSLRTFGDQADSPLVPQFVIKPGEWRYSPGAFSETGLCLSALPPGTDLTVDELYHAPSFRLFFRSYGSDEALAKSLVGAVNAWDGAGRPKHDLKRVRVLPPGAVFKLQPNQRFLSREWTTLLLDFSD